MNTRVTENTWKKVSFFCPAVNCPASITAGISVSISAKVHTESIEWVGLCVSHWPGLWPRSGLVLAAHLQGSSLPLHLQSVAAIPAPSARCSSPRLSLCWGQLSDAVCTWQEIINTKRWCPYSLFITPFNASGRTSMALPTSYFFFPPLTFQSVSCSAPAQSLVWFLSPAGWWFVCLSGPFHWTPAWHTRPTESTFVAALCEAFENADRIRLVLKIWAIIFYMWYCCVLDWALGNMARKGGWGGGRKMKCCCERDRKLIQTRPRLSREGHCD